MENECSFGWVCGWADLDWVLHQWVAVLQHSKELKRVQTHPSKLCAGIDELTCPKERLLDVMRRPCWTVKHHCHFNKRYTSIFVRTFTDIMHPTTLFLLTPTITSNPLTRIITLNLIYTLTFKVKPLKLRRPAKMSSIPNICPHFDSWV